MKFYKAVLDGTHTGVFTRWKSKDTDYIKDHNLFREDISFRLRCGKALHSIVLTKKGRVVLKDHDIRKGSVDNILRTLSEEKTACIDFINGLRQRQVRLPDGNPIRLSLQEYLGVSKDRWGTRDGIDYSSEFALLFDLPFDISIREVQFRPGISDRYTRDNQIIYHWGERGHISFDRSALHVYEKFGCYAKHKAHLDLICRVDNIDHLCKGMIVAADVGCMDGMVEVENYSTMETTIETRTDLSLDDCHPRLIEFDGKEWEVKE